MSNAIVVQLHITDRNVPYLKLQMWLIDRHRVCYYSITILVIGKYENIGESGRFVWLEALYNNYNVIAS